MTPNRIDPPDTFPLTLNKARSNDKPKLIPGYVTEFRMVTFSKGSLQNSALVSPKILYRFPWICHVFFKTRLVGTGALFF